MAGIAIPYGEKDGQLVHVSEVNRGLACGCVCPVCKDSLVARKGASKVAHFAHYSGTSCNRETLLHYLGKHVLMDRITRSIELNMEIPIEWKCTHCPDHHHGNLLKVARAVELERPLGECKPDLLLLDQHGKTRVFVEIVVTHRPEDHVRNYAERESIRIVEFKVECAEDIEALASDDTLRPSTVDLCTRPKCLRCGSPMFEAHLYVVDHSCWKCGAPMKVAFIISRFRILAPRDFTTEQRTAARRLGAILKMNYSRTRRERYLSNTCSCGAMHGDFFLHEQLDKVFENGGVPVGYMCSSSSCKDHN